MVNREQWVCWTQCRIFGICVQLQLLTKESAWSLLFIDVLMYSSDKKAKAELIDLSFLYNSYFYQCKKAEYIYMYMYQVYDVHFQFYFFIVSNMMDVKKKSLLTGRRDDETYKYKYIIRKLSRRRGVCVSLYSVWIVKSHIFWGCNIKIFWNISYEKLDFSGSATNSHENKTKICFMVVVTCYDLEPLEWLRTTCSGYYITMWRLGNKAFHIKVQGW